MSKGKKFLGLLSNETIHKLTHWKVEESHPSMVSNIHEIMNDLEEKKSDRNDVPSTSGTILIQNQKKKMRRRRNQLRRIN